MRWIEFKSFIYGFEGRAHLSCYLIVVEIVDIFIFLDERLGQVEYSIDIFKGFLNFWGFTLIVGENDVYLLGLDYVFIDKIVGGLIVIDGSSFLLLLSFVAEVYFSFTFRQIVWVFGCLAEKTDAGGCVGMSFRHILTQLRVDISGVFAFRNESCTFGGL